MAVDIRLDTVHAISALKVDQSIPDHVKRLQIEENQREEEEENGGKKKSENDDDDDGAEAGAGGDGAHPGGIHQSNPENGHLKDNPEEINADGTISKLATLGHAGGGDVQVGLPADTEVAPPPVESLEERWTSLKKRTRQIYLESMEDVDEIGWRRFLLRTAVCHVVIILCDHLCSPSCNHSVRLRNAVEED